MAGSIQGETSKARSNTGKAHRQDNFRQPPVPAYPLPEQVEEVEPLWSTYSQEKPADAFFDDAAANRACAFVERLYQFEGRFAGHRVRLMHWQRRLLREAFGWHIRTPEGFVVRLYRKIYLEVPRKNGKSTFSAAVALYLAFEDGEPAPQVFFAASDKDQASIAYGMARAMIETDPVMADLSIIYNSTKKIIIDATHGELRCLSSETKKLYGLNLHGNLVQGIGGMGDGSVIYRSEIYNNGSSIATGVNSGGIKSGSTFAVIESYGHDNVGNTFWCDNDCLGADPSAAFGYTFAHDFTVKNSVTGPEGRNGVRFEHGNGASDAEAAASRALIQGNVIIESNRTCNNPGAGVRTQP